MSDIIGNFISYGIDVKSSGAPQQKVKCPKCSNDRRDKRDKSLSVNIKQGLFRCHYCGWTGCVIKNSEEDKKYNKPEPYQEPEGLSTKMLNWFKSRGISETTVKSWRITEDNIWMPKDDGKTDTINFNYFQNNSLVNIKYRSYDKSFRMVKEAKLIFYGIDNTIGKEDIIITEGEMDALSFFESGFNNVISVPNGANKGAQRLEYLDNCINYFSDVERIYLAVDADDAGESLFQELARRLGRERCYRVRYPEECKDANETLMRHGIEDVKSLISDASPLPIEGILDVDEEYESIIELYNSGIERGEELEDFGSEFNKLCTFQRGKLYTITGIPTHGKSSFLEDIEVVLAAKKGWKFGVFSPEHYPIKYLIYRYAELLVGMPFFDGENERMTKIQLDKAIDFVKSHFFFVRPSDEMFTLENILDIGKGLVQRYGIDGFVIDPWNTIEHDFAGKSETQYTEKALNTITLWKQRHDCAVFLVAHPKKLPKIQTGENSGLYEVPSMYDIAGSSNFFNKTDIGITIYRNFKEGLTYFYVQKMKYRNLGEVGFATFKYNKLNNRFEPAELLGGGVMDEYGNPAIRQLSLRHKNLLQEEVEQSEMPMSSGMRPNMGFEYEEDDDLPF